MLKSLFYQISQVLFSDGLKNVWIILLSVSNNISLIYYIACLENRDFSKGGLFFVYMCVPIINTFYSLIMFCLNLIITLKKDFASFQNCRSITIKQALLLVKCILSNIIWAIINALLIELRLVELISQFAIYSKHSITINRDLEKYLLDNNLWEHKQDLYVNNTNQQNIDTDIIQLEICETENQFLPTQQDQKLESVQSRKMIFNQNLQSQNANARNKQGKQQKNSILIAKQDGTSSINRDFIYFNKQKLQKIDIQQTQNKLTEDIIFHQSQEFSLKDIFTNQIFKLSLQIQLKINVIFRSIPFIAILIIVENQFLHLQTFWLNIFVVIQWIYDSFDKQLILKINQIIQKLLEINQKGFLIKNQLNALDLPSQVCLLNSDIFYKFTKLKNAKQYERVTDLQIIFNEKEKILNFDDFDTKMFILGDKLNNLIKLQLICRYQLNLIKFFQHFNLKVKNQINKIIRQ
ncbi:transmembrane protein, putative (macronuclear) [Tetrahymena thermophila SB210]|uniref:Transmembrane protein, putative n=1 Tax=Tetrahymena thermophila (strain SB210) TaxID=312017 RepID=W7XJ73_TETTS|nr:transmembrane protein, putative [Tetrahymena thermophila SB210]EWS75271.1 transmembrane protein, putative [Tetrahymena thermophila SB210]|eukprot:XP_012652262.1 transmembrane protein, putative [Tetrahymena thermophila SB210]